MHVSHPETPPKAMPTVSASPYPRYTPGAFTASAIADTPSTKKCTTSAFASTATATCVHTSTSTTVADAGRFAHSPAVCDDTNATAPFACVPQHPTPVPPHTSMTAHPVSPCETIICALFTLDVLIHASTVSSPEALTACLNAASSVLYTDVAVSADKSSDIAVWSFTYTAIGGSPSRVTGKIMSPVDVDVAELLTRNSISSSAIMFWNASAASYRATGVWSGWEANTPSALLACHSATEAADNALSHTRMSSMPPSKHPHDPDEQEGAEHPKWKSASVAVPPMGSDNSWFSTTPAGSPFK